MKSMKSELSKIAAFNNFRPPLPARKVTAFRTRCYFVTNENPCYPILIAKKQISKSIILLQTIETIIHAYKISYSQTSRHFS